MNPHFSYQLTERSQILSLFSEHNLPYTIHTVVVRKIRQGGVYVRINAFREYFFACESLYFEFVLLVCKGRLQLSTTKKFLDGVGVILEMFKVAEQKEIGFAKRFRDLKSDCRYIAKTKVGRSQRAVTTYIGTHSFHWKILEYYRVTDNRAIFDKDFDGMLRGTQDYIFARVKKGIARFEYGSFADIESMNSQLRFTKIAETKFRNVVGHRGSGVWVVGITTDRKYEDLFNPDHADIDDEINATEVEIQLSPEFVQYVAENYDGQSIDPEFDQRLDIIGKPMHELLELVEKCTGKCLNVRSKSVTEP